MVVEGVDRAIDGRYPSRRSAIIGSTLVERRVAYNVVNVADVLGTFEQAVSVSRRAGERARRDVSGRNRAADCVIRLFMTL